MGKDNDRDTYVSSGGNGTDTVVNIDDKDTVIISGGIANVETVGKDLVITSGTGRTVVLKGQGENDDDDEEPNFPKELYGDDGTKYVKGDDGVYRPEAGNPPFMGDPFDPSDNANAGKDHAESQASPLVLDLDGDGVETTGLKSNTYFDHDGNGFSENTGWAGKDDGILIYDRNCNGEIDDGSELFGNNTILSNGKKAANGFEALKDLDSNKDGIFDANDAAFGNVKIWKDANGNGKLDAGELLTLLEAGVAGINLDYNNQNVTDANGNKHSQTGSYTKTDGTMGAISDVWFDANNSKTIYDPVEVPNDIKSLPNIQGFGNVRSLHEAMSLDTTGILKQLVQNYTNTTDVATRRELMISIMYRWTGVQDINPTSRAVPNGPNYIGDARMLEALEQFWGEDYINANWLGNDERNPRQQASLILIKTFNYFIFLSISNYFLF